MRIFGRKFIKKVNSFRYVSNSFKRSKNQFSTTYNSIWCLLFFIFVIIKTEILKFNQSVVFIILIYA